MLLKFIHNIQCCLVYFMFVKGWLLAFKSLIFLLSGPKQGTFKFFRKKKRAEGTLRSSICWRRQILRINEQLGWKERILHSWSLFYFSSSLAIFCALASLKWVLGIYSACYFKADLFGRKMLCHCQV